MRESLERIEIEDDSADKQEAEDEAEADAQKKPKTALWFVAPKSKSSARTIAIPEELVSALRRHKAKQAEKRLAAGPEWQESGMVFTNYHGGPIEPRNLNRSFKALLEKAGLPSTPRLHDLRQGCAALLLAQNVHPRIVMELLGHSQISLTLDTYSHVVPSLMREAADKMDALPAGGKGTK